MIGVTEKLAKTNALLANLCARYERARDAVNLVAVSKKQPVAAIREVVAAGQFDIGENYVAEALQKQQALADERIRWHFIGALQSNKTRAVAENFDVVHTVDRLRIAERLSAQRPHYARPLDVFIQVNIDAEASKSGISPAELGELAAAIADLPKLRLAGLMCLPKQATELAAQREPFRKLARLARNLHEERGMELGELSMGMSGDLEAAIAEGTTCVRIGTAVFGPRPGASA
ncbi:MAG: YggS family pyridoxal phosphate-dependent enzyme [Pseudomonadota bacterium]